MDEEGADQLGALVSASAMAAARRRSKAKWGATGSFRVSTADLAAAAAAATTTPAAPAAVTSTPGDSSSAAPPPASPALQPGMGAPLSPGTPVVLEPAFPAPGSNPKAAARWRAALQRIQVISGVPRCRGGSLTASPFFLCNGQFMRAFHPGNRRMLRQEIVVNKGDIITARVGDVFVSMFFPPPHPNPVVAS